MFVKRINKIYAPSSHGSRNNNATKTKKMVESKKQQASHADDFSRPLKVFTIECDPHGALIALYSQQSDAIYIISILTLLDFIEKFRSQFSEDGQYSFKTCLKPDLIITNPRPSLNIFLIKFSHKVQNTQLLTVVYYNGIIDIYSVVTGKKVDGLDLMQKSLHLGEEISPIYNVNILGHSLYISTYDGKLLCYQGHQLSKCTKNKDEWVRLAYTHIKQQKQHHSEEEQIDENQNEQVRDKKKGVIYQDKNNKLILGGSELKPGYLQGYMKKMKQKQKEVSKQINSFDLPTIDQNQNQLLSQSYKEYLRLETEKISIQNSIKPFTMTPCQRYIVWNIPISFVHDNQIISTEFYAIRYKNQNWRVFKDIHFPSFPYINHFWGLQLSSRRGELSEKKRQRIGLPKYFIEYCKKSRFTMIAVSGYYETQESGKFIFRKQSMNEKIITILRIRKKHAYHCEIICRLADIKQKVVSIDWIGPNMLLYLDETGNVYYMQINPELLIK